MKKLAAFFAILSMSIMPASAFNIADAIDFFAGASSLSGDEDAETTGGSTCHNEKLTSKCKRICLEFFGWITVCWEQSEGSVLMNGGLRYHTWSHDYKSRTDPSSCSPCGGVQSGSAGARLPELEITRYFEPESYTREHLTFGRNHGLK